MAYSKLSVINIGLGYLGVDLLASLTEGTPQQIKSVAVWDHAVQLVQEEEDWKFTKVRLALELAEETPSHYFDYAYLIPHDFLRFPVTQDKNDKPIYPTGYEYKVEAIQVVDPAEKLTNPNFTGNATSWTLGAQWTYATNQVSKAAGGVTTLSQAYTAMVSAPVVDETYLVQFEIVAISGGVITPTFGGTVGIPVSTIGSKSQYIVASSAVAGLVLTPSASAMTCTIDTCSVTKVTERLGLLTNYDNSGADLYINYIKRAVDVARWPGYFADCVAWKLASLLTKDLTEAREKVDESYETALIKAKGQNAALDYFEDEGNRNWEEAGRSGLMDEITEVDWSVGRG